MNLLDSDYIRAAQRQLFLGSDPDIPEFEIDPVDNGAWVITRVFVPAALVSEIALERVVEERYQAQLAELTS